MQLLLLYIAMLAPGWFVARALRLTAPTFLYAVSVSIMLAVTAVFTGKLVNIKSADLWQLWLAMALVAIALSQFIRWRRGQVSLIPGAELRPGPPGVAAVGVALAAVIYALWAGPYVEIPSDAIWHIGRIRDQYDILLADGVQNLASIEYAFRKSQGFWYIIQSQLVWNAGLEHKAGIAWLSLAHTVTVSVCIYWFSHQIFTELKRGPRESIAMALVATLFFALHFGLGVFSFLRYYTFGPVFLNYVVYLAAVLAMARYIESEAWISRWLVFILPAGFIMALVHKQETLFVMAMALSMLVVLGFRLISGSQLGSQKVQRKQKWLLTIGVIGYLGIHTYLFSTNVRNNPLLHDVMTDIGELLPFLQNLYILKPDYQFFQVITVWGVLVYLLYLLQRRGETRHIYLSAGMLLPLITAFNPVFTDLFLRLSWPEVLWRISFVVPLELIGAFFFVTGVLQFTHGSWLQRIKGGVVALLLLLLLVPVNSTYFVNHYSKFHMLAPVSAGNDVRVWIELLDRLDTMKQHFVLTDPVTGYTINAYTHHKYPAHKFSGRGMLSMGDREYVLKDFERYRGWLLVINKKDGNHSVIGEKGQHWSRNTMKPRLFYRGSLHEFVRDNPDVFKRVWKGKGQWIYQISTTNVESSKLWQGQIPTRRSVGESVEILRKQPNLAHAIR